MKLEELTAKERLAIISVLLDLSMQIEADWGAVRIVELLRAKCREINNAVREN